MFDLSTLWCKLLTLSKNESVSHSEFLTVPVEITENDFVVLPYDSEKYSFVKKVHRVFCFGVDNEKVLVASPRMIINSLTAEVVSEYEKEFENKLCLNEVEKIMLGSMNVDRVKIQNYLFNCLSLKDYVFMCDENGRKRIFCSFCTEWIYTNIENKYLSIHFILKHLTQLYAILTKNVFIQPQKLSELNLLNSGTAADPVYNIVIPQCEKCKKQLRIVNNNEDYSKITFTCDYCTSRNHCFNYDDVADRFNCNICDKSYKNFCSLKRHLFSVHSLKYIQPKKNEIAPGESIVEEKPPKIVCLKCNREFDTVDECEEHNKKVHAKQRKLFCGSCNLKFKNRKNYILHTAICQFKSKKGFDKDNVEIKENENNLLTAKYGKLDILDYHTKEVNKLEFARVQEIDNEGNNRLSRCYTCRLEFKSNNELKRHLLIVHRKMYKFKCTLCRHKKKFRDKYDLKRHLKNVHKMTDIPPGNDFLISYLNNDEDEDEFGEFAPVLIETITLKNVVNKEIEPNSVSKKTSLIFRNSERGYYWDRKT